MKIVSDKGTHYFVVDTDWRGIERRRKVQRFLCLGGPLDKAYRSRQELMAEKLWKEYNAFNNAGMSSHTMIFIHDDLIHGD